MEAKGGYVLESTVQAVHGDTSACTCCTLWYGRYIVCMPGGNMVASGLTTISVTTSAALSPLFGRYWEKDV